jgi:predicted NUDIX family NTP pyrophosphohydrolase
MKRSVGVLVFRRNRGRIEVFLVHPGGPYWAKKDLGAWTIPKGEYEEGEDPLAAARHEFQEETGFVSEGDLIALGEVKQSGGKRVRAWATEGDMDPSSLVSNTFSIEWPPHSGQFVQAPEVDRGEWFPLAEARKRILGAQVAFLDALASVVPSLNRSSEGLPSDD